MQNLSNSETKSIIAKAEILIESLPYIQSFANKTFVIKYGGNAMINDTLKNQVMEDITLLKFIGINPVIVHGGGPDISSMLDRLDITSRFVNGLRVTDQETMSVAQMVLIGRTNKEIVSLLNQKGAQAVGISGIDGSLIKCRKIERDHEGNPLDIGFVGEITHINTHIIEMLAQDAYIPVIAPIGIGDQGESYNINADTVAARIAAALKAEKLITLTDVAGVTVSDSNGKPVVLSTLKEEEADRLIGEEKIKGGMIPKVTGCIQTLKEGVSRAHIIDGRVPHCLLLEIFTNKGIGTMLTIK